MALARQISRPRLVGSPGEEETARELVVRLEELGLRVDQQRFTFIDSIDSFVKLLLGWNALLILSALYLLQISRWAYVLPAGLVLPSLIFSSGMIAWVQRQSLHRGETPTLSSRWLSYLGPTRSAINILGRAPTVEGDVPPVHLYLCAHYDSKSQRLPIGFRISLFVLLLLGALIFILLSFASIIFPDLASTATIFGVGSVVISLPLFFQKTGNESSGAVDNASGVGLVLHLIEVLMMDAARLRNVSLTTLFTSAEEQGTIGAIAFVHDNGPLLRRQAESGRLHVLNFDGIGSQGKLQLSGGGRGRRNSLSDLLQAGAQDLHIPTGRLPLIGALMDHLPFRQQGFDALSLSSLGGSLWDVHTRRDSVDKLHRQGFDQAGRLTIKALEKLAATRVDMKNHKGPPTGSPGEHSRGPDASESRR
jgi:hypothetical protein